MLFRHYRSQSDIDRDYNPAFRTNDEAAELSWFQQHSADARELLDHHTDIAFGPTLAETLDVFPAANSAKAANAANSKAPVFIFVHGGYWRALSSKEFSFVATGLNRLGIMTVVVNYALCPKVRIDEITRQVRAAIAWVLKSIPHLGGDPERVAIGGHSAGGHLAAMSLATDWSGDYGLGVDPLRGAVLLSGLYDIEPLRFSYLQPMVQIDEHLVRHQSPLEAARQCATPAWITWGANESDAFAWQARQMHARWSELGNESRLQALEGCNHYTLLHGFVDPDSEMCQRIESMLR